MKTLKYLLFIFAMVVFAGNSLYSQPGWVKNAILNGEKITPDKKADALILHDVVAVNISNSSNATTQYQKAYKILSGNGAKFGLLSVPIYPFLKIKELKGWSIKSDGKCTTLSKENIMTLSTEKSAGYYDDSHIVVASLSGVTAGDVVAFELTTEEKGWTSLTQSHVFQEQQPVLYSKFSIRIPANWELIKAEWHTENINFEQQENDYIWTATQLPFQPDEPLAPSWHFLSRRLSVTCYHAQKSQENQFANWDSVANWCARVYAGPASFDHEIRAVVDKILSGKTGLEERIQAIANFCQTEIRYVAVEIDKGRWQPRPATKTLFNRFGDCKDKTTLMRAMLSAIDIPSVPVLANVTYPVDPRLPTPFQFNHCIIAIPITNKEILPRFQNAVVDNWLFFDPTDPITQIGELPWVLQGDRVLIGVPRDTILYRLPYPEPQDFRRVYFADAQLNSDLSFSASVTITDYNSWATLSRHLYQNVPVNKQIEDWRETILKIIPNSPLTNLQTVATGDSTWVAFEIQGKNYVQKMSDLYLFRLDLFNTSEAPLLTADKRQHPIWLGSPKQVEVMIKWKLPARWSVEMDSTVKRSNYEFGGLDSKIAITGNNLNFAMSQRQNGRLIWPADYFKVREYCKDLSSLKGRAVLLKRN